MRLEEPAVPKSAEELGMVWSLDIDTETEIKSTLLILTNLFKLSQFVVYSDAQGLRPHVTCESKRLTRGITSPNPCTYVTVPGRSEWPGVCPCRPSCRPSRRTTAWSPPPAPAAVSSLWTRALLPRRSCGQVAAWVRAGHPVAGTGKQPCRQRAAAPGKEEALGITGAAAQHQPASDGPPALFFPPIPDDAPQLRFRVRVKNLWCQEIRW